MLASSSSEEAVSATTRPTWSSFVGKKNRFGVKSLRIDTSPQDDDDGLDNQQLSNLPTRRQRRKASQIERKFVCAVPGCARAYGTEGSLNQHNRIKHASVPASNYSTYLYGHPTPTSCCSSSCASTRAGNGCMSPCASHCASCAVVGSSLVSPPLLPIPYGFNPQYPSSTMTSLSPGTPKIWIPPCPSSRSRSRSNSAGSTSSSGSSSSGSLGARAFPPSSVWGPSAFHPPCPHSISLSSMSLNTGTTTASNVNSSSSSTPPILKKRRTSLDLDSTNTTSLPMVFDLVLNNGYCCASTGDSSSIGSSSSSSSPPGTLTFNPQGQDLDEVTLIASRSLPSMEDEDLFSSFGLEGYPILPLPCMDSYEAEKENEAETQQLDFPFMMDENPLSDLQPLVESTTLMSAGEEDFSHLLTKSAQEASKGLSELC